MDSGTARCAGAGAALHLEEDLDQVGAHGHESFGVGFGRDDVQQRDERVGGGRDVVA
jgi:hypothetical protein